MTILNRSLPLALALAASLAGTAQAADHRMEVTEAHPSASDPSMAFVELQDPAAESFPDLSYTLASLDASGNVIGQQTFNPPYGFANTAEPFLVGAAGRQGRDATLTISLAGARKVCFYRGAGTSQTIDCLSFDEVPEGRSAQDTSAETVVYACPTPDAPNRQTSEACAAAPAPVATMGTMPPPVVAPPPAADTRAPVQSIGAARLQRLRLLGARVRLNESARLTVTAATKIGTKKITFRKISRQLAGGAKASLRFKLSAAKSAVIRRSLGRGARPTVVVRVVARDAAGNVSKRTLKIRLRK